MTSDEDILKLKQDIEWDMLDETSYEIFTSILKDLEELKESQNVSCGGRMVGKEITMLNETLHKSLDKPILWVGAQVGNKYIVPQKQFEEMTKKVNVLNELMDNSIDCCRDYFPNSNLYIVFNSIPKEFIDMVSERRKSNDTRRKTSNN